MTHDENLPVNETETVKPPVQFTPNQTEVINATEGPVLVVACPGSGKTTTVVARTNQLLENSVDPDSILVITFTKAAAAEMGSRFKKKYNRKGPAFKTIHGFCLQVLRSTMEYRYIEVIKAYEQFNTISSMLKERYNIVDTNILRDLTRQTITFISAVINSDNTFDKVPCSIRYEGRTINAGSIYDEYCAYKNKQFKIDYDDMLIICRKLLRENPYLLDAWSDKLRYITVDEYQDTNVIQADIIYMLARKYNNICIVGDDDQSIYGFRSADSTIMLNFANEFADCRRYYLDTNYRSDPAIITLATRLIQNNTLRYEKEFKSGSKDVRPCTIERYDYDVYSKMLQDLKANIEELREKGIPYYEMAILYRINKQVQPVMNFFEEMGIPYHIKENSVSDIHEEFYFTDIVDYYKMITSPNKESFSRTIKHPNRFIPKAVWEKCDMTEKSFQQACNEHYKGQPYWKKDKCLNSIDAYYYLLEKLKRCKTPAEFVKTIYTPSYFEWAFEDFQGINGKDYTADMLKVAFQTIYNEAKKFKTMEEWMEFAANSIQKVNHSVASGEGISLSTYHGAKGLEWDAVLLIDVNDGITPSCRAESSASLEEERRMFYVALTRARKHVRFYVTGKPSPYLAEMGVRKAFSYIKEYKEEVEEAVDKKKENEEVRGNTEKEIKEKNEKRGLAEKEEPMKSKSESKTDSKSKESVAPKKKKTKPKAILINKPAS